MVAFIGTRLGDIYLLICNVSGKKYIGSSVNMSKRISKHEGKSNSCESKIIIDSGNYNFIILYSRWVNSKVELEHYEKKIIRLYKRLYGDLCINVKSVYENTKEQKKDHYQKNKKELNEQMKDHYQKNKKVIAVQGKVRYQENQQAILKQKKEYYQKNQQAILEKRQERRDKKIIKSWLDNLISQIPE
tara:strand:- start:93 stop:656 length:564 start_codon:yes stop_codon:yes gene_type:complete